MVLDTQETPMSGDFRFLFVWPQTPSADILAPYTASSRITFAPTNSWEKSNVDSVTWHAKRQKDHSDNIWCNQAITEPATMLFYSLIIQ